MYRKKLNRVQQLFTESQWKQLLANQAENQTRTTKGEVEADFVPVVKLFNPRGAGTWLLTECNEYGMAFGLCDLGQGFPELGYVSMLELRDIGFIERDLHFHPSKRLSEYTEEASNNQEIIA